jgi:hypothetical protein
MCLLKFKAHELELIEILFEIILQVKPTVNWLRACVILACQRDVSVIEYWSGLGLACLGAILKKKKWKWKWKLY